MNRFGDISELLLTVENSLVTFNNAYASAAKDEYTKAVLRPLVKSSLEHLRSSLEYCAQDTHERLFGGKRHLYFPYGKDEQHFTNSVANNLPGLQKRAPVIYDLFASLQPHKSGRDWLITLCTHTNLNKHDSLTKPDRVNSAQRSTTLGNLVHLAQGVTGGVMVSNCVINGQPVGFEEPMVVGNDISTETLRKQVGPHVKLEREFAWVEFRFPGTKMDALGLIKESHLAISEFASKLKAALP